VHRTQIQLEEAQYEQIRRIAHRERISFAAAVRRLLDSALGGVDGDRPRGAAALLGVAGVARGGPPDLAERHDEYLAEDRR
jgi:hypothetical protein